MESATISIDTKNDEAVFSRRPAEVDRFYYDNKIVRAFGYATVAFSVIGMLAGLFAAVQIYLPQISMNFGPTTFGRVRPLHTNAIIFAFVGNATFAGVYYSLQRLCKTRMFSDRLSWIHFWGWQSIILAAAISLVLGKTTGKEYAELEWPIDIAITLVWVIFGINMFGTIVKRREKHLYVAIWFYIATFVTVAVLHLVRSGELPYTFEIRLKAALDLPATIIPKPQYDLLMNILSYFRPIGIEVITQNIREHVVEVRENLLNAFPGFTYPDFRI